MFYLEKAARAQLLAQSTGARLRIPPHHVAVLTAQQWVTDMRGSGDREWPSLLRKLARDGHDYKQ